MFHDSERLGGKRDASFLISLYDVVLCFEYVKRLAHFHHSYLLDLRQKCVVCYFSIYYFDISNCFIDRRVHVLSVDVARSQTWRPEGFLLEGFFLGPVDVFEPRVCFDLS